MNKMMLKKKALLNKKGGTINKMMLKKEALLKTQLKKEAL